MIQIFYYLFYSLKTLPLLTKTELITLTCSQMKMDQAQMTLQR